MIRLRQHGSQTILAMASAVLLTFSFPKAGYGWLAWLALAPLLLALRQVRPKTGFLLGFTFGLVHNTGLVYWTVHTMNQYGNIPMFQAIFLLILLAAYLSLYPGLFSALLTWLRPSPGKLIFIAPAIWVVLEMVRDRLFTGFPWELLGYSQYKYLWLIQAADLFGVYSISALIVAVNAVLAVVLLGWLELSWQDFVPDRKLARRAAGVMLAVLVCTTAYGILRMRSVDQTAASSDQAKVAVIQGNIDQAQKWDPRFQVLTTVKYRRLSLEPAAKSADLVIWPETAAPFYLWDDKVLTDMVLEGVKSAGAYFIIGSPSYAAGKGQLIYHNSAFMITPQGKPAGKYDKVHLVPFGEYVPLRRFLPFIHKLVAQVGDFRPGRRGRTLPWDHHRAGVLICYESIFPGLARAMVANGADLLVNITNDAWFGRTSAAYQHFSMAVFRAVENRRSLARAANTGISGFIDACGRILVSTDLFTEAVAARPLALIKTRSFYSRWGDWPLGGLSFALTALCIGLAYRREKQATPQ